MRMTPLAIINLSNIRYNLLLFKRIAKKPICFPVKANAYGHGIVEVAKATQDIVECFGVANLDEGIILRENGIKNDILLFSAFFKEEIAEIHHYHIIPTISSYEHIDWIINYCKKKNVNIPIQIKIDTGMGRLGIWHHLALPFIEKAISHKEISLVGVYSHLAQSEYPNDEYTLHQINIFDDIVKKLKRRGIKCKFHLLNSSGVFNYPSYAYDMIRPGISSYGYFTDYGTYKRLREKFSLKPAMKLIAKVLLVKEFRMGDTVSYNRTYCVKDKKEYIAMIGIGYGDGLKREFSNKGFFTYKNHKLMIRGRICMDITAVNIPKETNLKIGDCVEVYSENLEELSSIINTIPYELTTSLTHRVRYKYL
jgi:alanine racemase